MTIRSVQMRGRLGVYLDRPSIDIPEGGLSDARNCRLRGGQIRRDAMGWSSFYDIVLNGPVTLIHGFTIRAGASLLVFGTPTDLYEFDTSTSTVSYLTPRIEDGTGYATNGSDVYSGPASWADAKVGDKVSLGTAGVTDPDAVWYTVLSKPAGVQVQLDHTWTETTGFIPYTIRRVFTGTRLDVWSSEVYYDVAASGVDYWYATNGVDVPVRWNPSEDQVTLLTALAFTCKFLAVFNGMMVYGNVTEGGDVKSNVFRNSAIGNPENVTTDEAVETNGTDISDRLVRALPIADLLAMYGYSSISLAQFVGPPLMWVVRTISRKRGVLSDRSVVDRGEFHEFPSRDGAFRFDGVRTEEFAPQVFRILVDSLATDRLAQTIGFLDLDAGEVFWVIPSTQDGQDPATAVPTTAWVEQYMEDVGPLSPPMMPRDLPATAFGLFARTESLRFDDLPIAFPLSGIAWNDRLFNAGFPMKLMGLADGTIMELGMSDAQDGEDFTSYARFRRIALSDGVSRGFVLEAEAVATEQPDASHSVDVAFYTADRVDGALSLAETITADLTGAGLRWKRPRVLARFLEVQVQTAGAAVPFALSGVRLKVEDRGSR